MLNLDEEVFLVFARGQMTSRCKMRVLEQPEKLKLKFNQLFQNPIHSRSQSIRSNKIKISQNQRRSAKIK